MGLNWGGGISGGASGAAAGSAFGLWGTAIGGAVGLAGGLFGGGQQGPTETWGTSSITPYGNYYGKIDQQLNDAQRISNRWSGPENGYAVDFWNKMRMPGGPGGGGGGGGGAPQFMNPGGGGGGGNFQLPGAKEAGFGGRRTNLGNVNAKPDEYLKEVLEGDFLERGNPYQAKLLAQSRGEGQRTLRSSLGAITGAASNVGGVGGSSAAFQKAMANQNFLTQQSGAETGLLERNYNFERGNMMQGLGMLSQQTQNLRSSTAQQDVGSMQAAASKYSSYIGGLVGVKQAQIGAASRRFDSIMGYNSTLANNATQRRGQSLDYRLGLGNLQLGQFDRALSLDNQIGMGRAGGYEQISGYGAITNPLLEGFGEQNTYSSTTNPGYGTNWGGVAQDVIGAGATLWGNFGQGKSGQQDQPAQSGAKVEQWRGF